MQYTCIFCSIFCEIVSWVINIYIHWLYYICVCVCGICEHCWEFLVWWCGNTTFLPPVHFLYLNFKIQLWISFITLWWFNINFSHEENLLNELFSVLTNDLNMLINVKVIVCIQTQILHNTKKKKKWRIRFYADRNMNNLHTKSNIFWVFVYKITTRIYW